MNTNSKNTAESLARSRTTRRRPRRPSKLALLRAKVVTIVLAVILFLASLLGIAIYNPGVAAQTAQPAQSAPTQHINVVQPGSSSPQVVPAPPHVTTARPLFRSRGS